MKKKKLLLIKLSETDKAIITNSDLKKYKKITITK